MEDSKECVCPPIPPCVIPTTTPTPLLEVQSSTPSVTDTIVSIWTGSLNNITEEKLELTTKLERLSVENQHLIEVLKHMDVPDLNKIVIGGRIPPGGDPEDFARSFLREKLVVRDRFECAERNEDKSITVTMNNFQGKLNVLYAAKEKLKFSQIEVVDFLLQKK